MEKRFDLKGKLLKTVAKVAHKTAVKDANTACLVYNHQEKLPEKVTKLRKF
ncbi:MAG: cyclic lactone autoinducer peptide [Eubacteriaceae bacterium]